MLSSIRLIRIIINKKTIRTEKIKSAIVKGQTTQPHEIEPNHSTLSIEVELLYNLHANTRI